MNRVELVGGLTRDPEIKITQSGAVTWFATIAVNGTRYDTETRGQVVKTTYVALSAFGWLAEQLTEGAYERGDELHVLGELDQYEIEKEDGKKDRKTRVRPLVVNVTRRRAQVAARPDPWQNSHEPPPF